jgi:hypothetical protein
MAWLCSLFKFETVLYYAGFVPGPFPYRIEPQKLILADRPVNHVVRASLVSDSVISREHMLVVAELLGHRLVYLNEFGPFPSPFFIWLASPGHITTDDASVQFEFFLSIECTIVLMRRVNCWAATYFFEVAKAADMCSTLRIHNQCNATPQWSLPDATQFFFFKMAHDKVFGTRCNGLCYHVVTHLDIIGCFLISNHPVQ